MSNGFNIQRIMLSNDERKLLLMDKVDKAGRMVFGEFTDDDIYNDWMCHKTNTVLVKW